MFEKKLEPKDKIIQARIELQKEKPFFSYLTMQLKIHEMTEEEIKESPMPTMGVDSEGHLIYNPAFVEKLSAEECKAVLCHEVMHCALEHLTRRMGREPMIWNCSADAIINNMIEQNGMKLPEGVILPENDAVTIDKITIKDLQKKSSEEVYDVLYDKLKNKDKRTMKQLKQYLKDNKDKFQGFDFHIEGNGNGNQKQKQGKGFGGNKPKFAKNQKNWKKILMDACSYAKQQGNLPAGMERLVGKLLETKIDWRSMLYKYITSQIPIDYNWCRPHKKSHSLGYYLPGVERESIDVIVAIDTSGSISPKELESFISEVVSIVNKFQNVNLTVMDCDCEINSVKTFRNATTDKVMQQIKLRGGGGTSHIPVFKWINDNMASAKLLVCFTDGYTSYPEASDVSINTIWVISGEYRNTKDIPFGEVVEMPVDYDE